MRRDRSACVLVSGGVDSAALVAHFLRRGSTVHPVYVRSGYIWEQAELHWLRRLLAAMATPRLKPLTCLRTPTREFIGKSHWAITGRNVPGTRSPDSAVYLPGRNLLLISAASVFCVHNGISTIALGILRGNPFPDATRVFFTRLERALTSCFGRPEHPRCVRSGRPKQTTYRCLGRPFRIAAPFRGLTKAQVVGRFRELPFHLAFSCLSPSGHRPCGRCNKCEERLKALA